MDAAMRELRIALAELAYEDDREQVRAAICVLDAATSGSLDDILEAALDYRAPAPSLKDLRGIAPDATGDLSSEEFVRRIRQGWTPPWKASPAPKVTREWVDVLARHVWGMQDNEAFAMLRSIGVEVEP